jgi:hypothetical protein
MNLLQTRDMRWATSIALAAIAAIGLLYTNPIYRLAGPQTVLWIYDLAVILFSLAGVGLSFLLWRSFSQGEVLKTIWASLTLGLLLWTLGESMWSVDQLVFGEKLPYPSAADAAWLAGYVPLLVGLVLRYRSLQVQPKTGWRVAVLGAFLVLAALAVVFLILPIINSTDSGPLEQVVNVLYPIGDLTVALVALLIMLALTGGALSMPWGLIAAGYFLVSVSDLLYAFAVGQEIYQVDPAFGVNFLTYVINFLYAVSYVIVALGIYMQARLQRAI